MSSRMMVDSDNQLKELANSDAKQVSRVLSVLARLLSLVFHPLFIPVYIVLFLMNYQPMLFAGYPPIMKVSTTVMFFVIYTLFPLVTVLLAKGLGFLDSIFLKTQRDRIIPYIACEIYYFWIAYVLRHQAEAPAELCQLAIAIFLATTFGLMVNISIKVSMHAISMGILVAFMLLMSYTQSNNYTPYLSLTLLIAGLVCTARMVLSDHNQKEIYMGLLVGAASMLLGVWADGFLP